MAFCVQVLQQTLGLPPEQREPRKKDGALNVIGQVAEVLMKVGYCHSSHPPRDGVSVVVQYTVGLLMFTLAVLVKKKHIGVFDWLTLECLWPTIVQWFILYRD